jgi:hypothetical protein
MATATAVSSDLNSAVKSVLGYIAGALLMIVMGVTGAAYSDLKSNQDTLEQRVYVLQRDSVSESKLKDTELRINDSTAKQIDGVRNEVRLMNTYLEKLMEEIRNNNNHKR